jgi:hypothetical protein
MAAADIDDSLGGRLLAALPLWRRQDLSENKGPAIASKAKQSRLGLRISRLVWIASLVARNDDLLDSFIR